MNGGISSYVIRAYPHLSLILLQICCQEPIYFLCLVIWAAFMGRNPIMSVIGLLDRSQVIVSILCLYIYYLIGRRKALMSSVALNIALNALQITYAALTYILYSVLSTFLVQVYFFLFLFIYIKQAYIIQGSIVPLYILLRSMRLVPHIKLLRLLSVLTVFITFYLISLRCGFHVSLASIINPRYLQFGPGLISP